MNLRQELYELGMTQAEFARQIGAKKQLVNKWFLEKSKPDVRSQKLIRDKLKELKE